MVRMLSPGRRVVKRCSSSVLDGGRNGSRKGIRVDRWDLGWTVCWARWSMNEGKSKQLRGEDARAAKASGPHDFSCSLR